MVPKDCKEDFLMCFHVVPSFVVYAFFLLYFVLWRDDVCIATRCLDINGSRVHLDVNFYTKLQT